MGLLWAREDSNGFLVSGKAPWQLLIMAVPQPRLLPRHNTARTEEGRQTSSDLQLQLGTAKNGER